MKWPVWLKFTDAYNQEHKIELYSQDAVCTLWIPVSNKQILWYCGVGQERTGFDKHCTWAKIQFSWVDKTAWINPVKLSHGVRIQFLGYRLQGAKEYYSDWNRFQAAVQGGKDITAICAKWVEMGTKVAAAVKK